MGKVYLRSYEKMKFAVLLAGQLRTWPRAAKHIFSYYNKLGVKPDYYLATWDKTRDFWWPEEHSIKSERAVDLKSDIQDIFDQYNQTVVNVSVEPMIPRHDISYYYQAHLAKICNTMKQQHERLHGTYDQVVETRPDVFLVGEPKNISRTKIMQFTGGYFWKTDEGLPQVSDFYFRSDSTTNDIISRRDRFNLNHERGASVPESMFGNHYVFARWLMTNGLTRDSSQSDFEHAGIFRPNFPENPETLSVDQIKKLDQEWIHHQWYGSH